MAYWEDQEERRVAEAQETRLRPYDEPDDDGEFSPPSGAGSTGPGSSM